MDINEFTQRYDIQLNQQQLSAVRETEGAVLLLAVPGSGKTTVLVTRLGFMIFCKGIAPESILTMTYTVAATRDMSARFASLFGNETAARLNFSTINSVSCQILRYFERTLGRKAFELISSEQELGNLIGEIYKRITGEFAQEGDIKNVRSLITYAKNMLLDDDEITELEKECRYFSKIYREYCDALLKLKKMDFDDQMLYAYKILRSHPEILAYFRNRYSYICVDEAQDTSKIQHMIIRLLAGDDGNIFMVGDEDQSIYGFRAAYPEALMDFEKTYKNAKVLMLETNYRSTLQIVSNADSFIRQNKVRRQKNMRAALGKGSEIQSVKVKNRISQYAYLLSVAEKCTRQTAILYRDNDSAIPLIDMFERRGIAYRCRGNDSSFFTHPVVRDVVDIIRFASDPYDGELFMKIYYKFNKGISRSDALRAVTLSREKDIPVFNAMLRYCELSGWCIGNVRELEWNFDIINGASAVVAINRIVNFMGYTDYLDSRGADKSKLDILKAVAVNAGSANDFLHRLNELDSIIKNGSAGESNLILSTIHSAKGLEYDDVIIIDAFDGAFPKVDGNFTSEADQNRLEEERRLFYVAVTRAKRELTMMEYEDAVSMFTSHFFPDIKAKHIFSEIKKYKKTSPAPFSAGDNVRHKSLGKGKINSINNSIAEVAFSDGTVRYLDIEVAASKMIKE